MLQNGHRRGNGEELYLSAYAIFHWSLFVRREFQFGFNRSDNGTAQTCIGSRPPQQPLELKKESSAPETGKQGSEAVLKKCQIVYSWSSLFFLHHISLSVMWHQVLFLKSLNSYCCILSRHR